MHYQNEAYGGESCWEAPCSHNNGKHRYGYFAGVCLFCHTAPAKPKTPERLLLESIVALCDSSAKASNIQSQTENVKANRYKYQGKEAAYLTVSRHITEELKKL